MTQSRQNPNEYLVKTIIAGDPGVGKKSLREIVLDPDEKSEMYRIGCDMGFATFSSSDRTIKNQIWSLIGNPKPSQASPFYFKGARVGVFVFDRTRLNTLKSIDSWVEKYFENNRLNHDQCIITIVENKIDLPSNIEIKQIENVKEKIKEKYLEDGSRLHYFQTSITEKNSIVKLFMNSAREALSKVL